MRTSIKEIVPSQLSKCTEVIRKSFLPVAERFHLTELNCPTNTAFITLERLIFQSQNGVDMYGLYQDDEMIGFIGLDKREREVIIEHLCVVPEKQGLGLGKKLLEFAEKKTKEMGYGMISLGMIADNKELKAFYTANGYIELETRELPHLPFKVTYMNREIK